MTVIQLFYMMSCVLGGATVMVIFGLLCAPPPEFIRAERIGLGFIGGASIMLLPILYTRQPTPFDGWATTLLWIGVLTYFSARGYRALRHWWSNKQQARMYRP
jgi:hypothetical protein